MTLNNIKKSKPVRHGTDSAYSYHSCRCSGCTAAHAAASRDWRARRRAGLPTKSSQLCRDETPPRTSDIYWAAGFLEGEGSFTRAGHDRRCLVVAAAQRNRMPLDRLRALFGGSLARREYRGRRAYHTWQVSAARARGLVLTLYMCLSAERQAQVRRAMGRRDQARPE